MQFEGGYRYPGTLICASLSLISLGIVAFIWNLRGLSLFQGLSLVLTLEGTVLWASSLTPKGLIPPPNGFVPKIRWFFNEQGGTPLSLNQPMFIFGILFVLIGTIFGTLANGTGTRESVGQFKSEATMREIESAFGKPDRIDVEKGGVADGYESPQVIKWYYNRFPIVDSGPDYGKPGYLNFVPLRFIDVSSNTIAADKLAKEFGVEQSDSFRLTSYSGSFPVNGKREGHFFTDIDFIPIKRVGK